MRLSILICLVSGFTAVSNLYDSYWVHENSSVGENITSSLCSYLHIRQNGSTVLSMDGDCSQPKFFICEVDEEEKPISCLKGWTMYGDRCYKTFLHNTTYAQAASFCVLQRAKLAILDDIGKEHDAAAVIIGQKEVFLVGAKMEDHQYKWLGGNVFQPSCSECIHYSEKDGQGDCVGFHSDPQHPTLFTWRDLPCGNVSAYLCEMYPRVIPITVTQSPTQPPTTVQPLQCPVGYNWKAHEESGHCYWETTYESERLNWYQARQFCQVYGGDLATYENSDQEEHGLGGAKGHYRGLWFGLKRGETDDVFRWVDNSSLSYTNWYFNQPDLSSGTKYCVMHGPSNSEWELDYCGVRRWFVCKAPKIREPKLPNIDLFKKTPCNFSGPSSFKNQWYLFEDHCYLVRDDNKYSWDTARYFCQDNGGHMVSIHSFKETDFILQLIPSASSIDFWIGLSARGVSSSLSWSDGSPLNFLYWKDDFNVTESVNTCVIFDRQKGFWTTEHCNRFLGVICKRGVNASYDFSTPEPTSMIPGNCEKSWYRIGNKCVKPFGDKWSQRMTWHDAAKSCEQYEATLLSIHNQEEQDFATDLLLDIGTDTWIGLENINKGTIFKWSDDSPLDFTYWNSNEPMYSGPSDEDDYSLRLPSQSRLCVELDYSVPIGRWSDVPCYRPKAYICQKLPNSTLTLPSEDPFICTNRTGWNRLGTSCYKIFEENGKELDWVSAQARCRSSGADLVHFRNTALTVFLTKRMGKNNHFFWIGTRETKRNTYESISRRNVYTNWLLGQPQKVSDVDNCVSVNTDGKWIVKNCKEKHPFICEISSKEEDSVAVSEDTSNSCPQTSSWTDLGSDQCYYFGFRLVSWNNALFLCYKHGGHLASFHSMREMSLIKDYLKIRADTESSFHIGLGKQSDGSYGWVDHSPVDFMHWENEPPKVTTMNCVQLHPRTTQWRPVDCDDMLRNFICSYSKSTKYGNSQAYNLSTSSDTLKKETRSNKISAGGIFGIIIGLIIVLAATGGAVYYYFYPNSRVKLTLLEPDNL